MTGKVIKVSCVLLLFKGALFIAGLTETQTTKPLDAEDTKATKHTISREQK